MSKLERPENNPENEKQKHWNETVARIEKTVDGLGHPIDGGIKETVIGLNALGINTTASCEGHADRGIAAPWIYIETEEAAESSNVSRKKLKNTASDEEKRGIWHEHHERLNQAKEKGLELMKKMMNYLESFYKDRAVPFDTRLILESFADGARLQNQGTLLQKFADEETKIKKLAEYQAEMRIFVEFLKQKFFEET